MESLTVLLLVTFITGSSSADYKRVCYYTNWSQYRQDPWKFTPSDIPGELCTHLIYAFASMEGNHLKAAEWNDESTSWSKGMYETFNEVKLRHPTVVTLLAVGGWNFGTKKMTAMLRTQPNRAEFIRTSIGFLRNRTFDGLDLDFEYPANRGSPSKDRALFAFLVQEMRLAFEIEGYETGRQRLLLSAAVPAGIDTIKTGYDVPSLTKHLDFINLMTYDFHGYWDAEIGHNAPLFSHSLERDFDATLNLAYATNLWLQLGADPLKLNVGLALYGRSYTLESEAENSVGAPAFAGGKAGRYTRDEGTLSFYEVCEFIKEGAEVFWIDDQHAPYAVHGDQWVSFDDELSLREKVRWMKANRLGGVMVWSLDFDDFRGDCSGQKFPLLQAINDELRNFDARELPSASSEFSALPKEEPSVVSFFGMKHPSSAAAAAAAAAEAKELGITTAVVEEFCVGRVDGFYVESGDCSRYVECHSGLTRNLRCPDGTYFNGTVTACVVGHFNQCAGDPTNELPEDDTLMLETLEAPRLYEVPWAWKTPKGHL